MTFDFHIMGGNLPSTLAGEFSFTIALALSLFFLGTLARALDRRGAFWLPAVLLALTFMSHIVVAIFAVYAGVVIWLIIRPVRNFTRAAAIAVVGVLLTAFWFLPLAVNLGNTTDMRYEPIGNYLDWMFISENWFIYPLALVALGGGIWFRRRSTLIVAAITVATGLVFWNWEGLREIFGKAPAWNLRLLPFWMLMLYLLAGLGAAELVRLISTGVTWVIRGDRAVVASAPPATRPPRSLRRPSSLRRGRSAAADASSRRAPRRDGSARRHHHDGLPRHRAERARLHPVLGSLQLHRLRERDHRGLHREVVARVPRLPRHREQPAARPHVVGGRRRHRRVRHAAGAHAAAVLDPRPHPVDGGPLLRGVDHHAVPLHDGRDACAEPVEPGAGAALQEHRRLRPRREVPAAHGCPVLRRVQHGGEGQGQGQPEPGRGRDRPRPRRQAAVGMDDLPGEGRAHGPGAAVRTGGRHRHEGRTVVEVRGRAEAR